MLYQVRVNLIFSNQGIAEGVYNHCDGVFPQATFINVPQPNAEFSFLELIENHHDETPNEPCHYLKHRSNQPT